MKKSADIVSSWIRSIIGAFLVLSIGCITLFIIQIWHTDQGNSNQIALVPIIPVPIQDIPVSGIPTVQPVSVPLVRYPYARVIRVIDGDTVVIQSSDMPKEITHIHNLDPDKITVRLIGMNTPETVDPRRPVQCFGKEASYEATRLLQDQIIRIETDDSQDMVDKYNRLLAYIFIEPKNNSPEKQFENITHENELFFNSYMIREGFAYEYTYSHQYRYQKQFKEEEKFAKDNENGLWQPGVCN